MKPGRAAPFLALLAVATAYTSASADPPVSSPAPSAARQGASSTTVTRCMESHERARLLKVDHKLVEALEAVKGCVSAECPLTLRADCSDWMTEITNLLPSVVLVIEGDDSDEDLRIYMDGQLVEPNSLGAPLVLSPGVHQLRLERPSHPPVEQSVTLGEGEKNRVLRVRIQSPAPPVAPAPVLETPPPRESPPSIPTVTYVLAGGALVSASVSVIFLGSALADHNRALETCAPTCKGDTRSSIDRRLLVADITGGLAIGLFAGAVYTYLTRPKSQQASSGNSSGQFRIVGDGTLIGARFEGIF